MTYTEKHIVASYSGLFESLSPDSKIELIEHLSKSLKAENKKRDARFYKSFGAFVSDKTAETILKEIKASRKFRAKKISL